MSSIALAESAGSVVRAHRDPALPLAGALVGFIAFAIAAWIVQRDDGPVSGLSVLLFGTATMPLVYRRLQGSLDLFEPIQLLAAVFALDFAVRAFCLVSDPVSYGRLGLYPYDDMLPTALAWALGGFCALVSGYGVAGWFLARATRPRSRAWPARAPIGKIVVLIVIGGLATAAMVGGGKVVGGAFSMADVSAGTFAVIALSQFVQFSAAICAIYLARAREVSHRIVPAILLLGILLPMSAIQAFVFGSKSKLLMTVFMVVGAFNYAGRRRLRLTTALIAVLTVLVVIFPAVNLYRVSTFRIGSTTSVGAFLTSLGEFSDFLIQSGFRRNTELAFRSVVDRSHGVDSLSLVIKYGEHTDLAQARDYFLIPAYAFIPRALWPSKPISAASLRFTQAFLIPLDSSADPESTPSFGIFHIGDLYASFGPRGMLAGLFILGAIYRGLYWRYDPLDGDNRRGIFMFMVLLWLVVNGFESDVPTVYAGILKMLVVLWGVGAFIAESRPARGRTSAPADSGHEAGFESSLG